MRYGRSLRIAGFVALWLAATAGMSYVAVMERDSVIAGAARAQAHAVRMAEGVNIGVTFDHARAQAGQVVGVVADSFVAGTQRVAGAVRATSNDVSAAFSAASRKVGHVTHEAGAFAGRTADAARSIFTGTMPFRVPMLNDKVADMVSATASVTAPVTLSEIMERRDADETARALAQQEPASGAPQSTWQPEQDVLDVEAVLVPRQVTVISSSQDGRIAAIAVDHGDHFRRGDVLVSYDCAHLQAEADIAKIEKEYTEKRKEGSNALFKLEIISDMDRIGALVEDKKATAKDVLYKSRLRDCEIRAEFDGRVTNRLANPGEYTRTDRVLLEVASEEALQAEFLVPSKWLRWINIGAPVPITIAETERTYSAKIVRIYGEVDPVSQSIQMIATLDSYEDPLLPGMSGKATIDVNAIRKAGVRGYLEARAAVAQE